MRVPRSAYIVGVMLVASGSSAALAQHAGHTMPGMSPDSAPPSRMHVMVSAVPLVTRAAPTAGGAPATQAVVSQPVMMVRGAFAGGRGQLAATLDAEGLTMPNGELNTGGYGEGFVDRRHPHTYVHELMLTGLGDAGSVKWSASAGRGFAPFGTDDPMMRPIVKFPINHHLAQILERAAIIGAVASGPFLLEAATFGGDEPTHPSSLPRPSRFGDSWSVRATVTPIAALELQASLARVASPEDPGGFGLDQRKQSASARAISHDGARYLMVEWASTTERDPVRARDVFDYGSVLAEGAVQRGPFGLAIRVEQSERPEEDRLDEPFRTPRPSTDLSINGVTQWRTITLHFEAAAYAHGSIAGSPFLEWSALSAEPRNPQSLFTPERLYGTSRFTMLTAGFRLRVGGAHARMGRYGVADINGPAIGSMTGGAESHQH